MKYVVFDGHNGEQIIIFPKKIQHSVMASDVEESSFGTMYPISGGFIVNGQCVGESESLRMKSRGGKDTELIAAMLCLDEDDQQEKQKIYDLPVYDVTIKPSVNKNKAKRLRKKQR